MNVTTITAGSNHPGVVNLRGWSLRATASAVVNLRAETDSGQILATLGVDNTTPAGPLTIVLPEPLPAEGGTYVEVVSGTIVGVLYH